jgi:hypothetical protein
MEVWMARLGLFGLLLGFCLVGACDQSDKNADGAAGAPAEPSPLEACQTYASTWCNKALGCYVQVGRIDDANAQTDTANCTQLINDRLPCSAATSVTDDYDKCISQIKGMACSKWNVPQTQFASVVPPASCDTALGFDE